MTEPRMRMRQKGQQFATPDLEAYLIAFGDDRNPLPETVRVLDEIVTDYIIETCHAAALCASYSRRAKIKVDDFKFTLRKDPKKLGRVTELLQKDKEIKKSRRAFDVDDDAATKEVVGAVKEKDKDDGDGKTEDGRKSKKLKTVK
ncbi:hypothetical protein B0A49_10818 [Cryomyces minteri]|uniref:Transcription initiation factor TFIID subunit 13 n=2 Tax=Cryomyces minteri TaxID=331657 RepID=A0A4V5NAM9_9PEZI|nr:hypothetical protein B0A49_10818 [Cryomyces minteri]